MEVAYIAGPYRAGSERSVVENIRHAEDYAIKYWRKGYAVICPHLNSALMGGVVPDDTFLEGDLEIIRRVDLVVMIPGWRKSEGARAERELAASLGLVIIYEGIS